MIEYGLEVAAVSNSPCGVERAFHRLSLSVKQTVSNSPCGVERRTMYYWLRSMKEFLIHRVELKARLSTCMRKRSRVSNSPCGVESNKQPKARLTPQEFLIHRVELKDRRSVWDRYPDAEFLIHRVELKDYRI